VPARNEEESIVQSVGSLLDQQYCGEFHIVIVDDESHDSTAAIAQQVAIQRHAEDRVTILTAPPLPPGWTGKLWALNNGIAAAPLESSYLWLTDADISHAPDTLTRLVSRAEQGHRDLVSLMVLLQSRSLPERVIIPAFLFFFLKLYPPSWTASSKARTAGAAGGCILLRREALDRIGGLAAIRGEIIDDCALASAVKRAGGHIWMGLTRSSVSLRAYGTFRELSDMIARTAFTQLRYSILMLLGTVPGLFLTYLTPVALLFVRGSALALALFTWVVMSLLFLPIVRFYRLNPIWAVLLPFTAAFYAYATLLSAGRYYLNRGGQWKGRSQAPNRAQS
jgi:hopene-associated glycosyltransferase HpnB